MTPECTAHFLAVKKVLIATLKKNSVTLERNEVRQESCDHIDRSLEELAILFRSFLTSPSLRFTVMEIQKKYLKNEAVNTFLTRST